MPAIDPSRLDREIQRILASLSDPPGLNRGVLDLLETYAERTRRPGQIAGSHRVIGVERPVMRSLARSLRAATAGRPALAWPVVEALWESGYRESQVLASEILGGQCDERIPEWAQGKALTCDDIVVRTSLARDGLACWRRENATESLGRIADWMDSVEEGLRAFALLALQAAVEDPDFKDLPSAFQLLHGVVGEAHGETQRALYGVVRSLAQRSPPETARFLLDELTSESVEARRMVQRSLHSFPPRQRSLLKRALTPNR